MADDKPALPDAGDEGMEQRRGLSLEQALLAPLDSILKAQVHSARSFLNLILQLGYPHNTDDENETQGGTHKKKKPAEPYPIEFTLKDQDGEEQLLKVPALSLVPIAPLAVESASFELEMAAKQVVRRDQIRKSEGTKADSESKKGYDSHTRPWFLVKEPLDIYGEIVQRKDNSSSSQESAIKINLQVKSIPPPPGLEKLLSALTNMSGVSQIENDDENNS